MFTVKYYINREVTLMQDSKTLIRFPTHTVRVEVKGDHIHCFKFADHGCDFNTFGVLEQYEASDWIIEPLNQIHYRVTFPGED